MDQPASALITVVIPAFNVGPYIRRCVASLLQQTHRELEVIVVNDASVDDTAAILDGLMAADSRLKVHHLPRNIGVHAARALGLQSAAGTYVGFVDSDDWVAPRMYATLCGEAVRADADIVVCGATTALSADRLGNPKVRFRRRQVIESNLLPRFCRLEFGSGVLWNKLYATELVRPFAFLPLDRNVDAAEDYIVNIGCFARSRRVVTLPESSLLLLRAAGERLAGGSQRARLLPGPARLHGLHHGVCGVADRRPSCPTSGIFTPGSSASPATGSAIPPTWPPTGRSCGVSCGNWRTCIPAGSIRWCMRSSRRAAGKC